MSRLFNGTNQALSVALDLSSYAQLSIACWLWVDTASANDSIPLEHTGGGGAATGALTADAKESSRGGFSSGIQTTTGGIKYWWDFFTRPSAAAWHHYVLTYNRATPVTVDYVDGALASLTLGAHTAGTYGNFANSTFNFMARNHASLWTAGRLAHVAFWGGTILSARNALALSVGASPMRIGPIPTYYWPLWGDAADADYAGTRKTLTLTGTPTAAAHPRVMANAF